ncbi:transposase [Candidatus Dependentiae bacterium]|nr:transposase [Candidatus Dependentiae bacterium]
MKTKIQIFNNMIAKVQFFFKQLKLKIIKSTGRPLAVSPEETIALSLFKQSQGIKTKKSVWEIFNLKCSYKTLVVNMNRLAIYAFLILQSILKWNQKYAHIVKHTDSTDISVCLTKNASRHRTMSAYANWAHGPKGWYYGLKMSITTDLRGNLLVVSLGSGNSNDRTTFKEMNKDMMGIFIADAGYLSKDLERDFFIENKRILFAKPRANMKKIATEFQNMLYDTRMLIELNFRNLKMFYGLETSLPKSVDGYLGNYVYSILGYVLA